MIKNNINDKKVKKLSIITFFAILTFFLIVSSYGIFESGILRDVDIDIAVWQVKINDSIITNEEKTFSIEDITWDKSDNVLEGKVAPGIDGYFDIEIDPNGTDVSIKYELVYDVEYLQSINSAFKITKIEELTSNNLVLTDKDTYTGVINLEDINSNKKHVIRTHIEWEDNEENNDNDYLTGSSSISFELPITINVTQYLGEEIKELDSGE